MEIWCIIYPKQASDLVMFILFGKLVTHMRALSIQNPVSTLSYPEIMKVIFFLLYSAYLLTRSKREGAFEWKAQLEPSYKYSKVPDKELWQGLHAWRVGVDDIMTSMNYALDN